MLEELKFMISLMVLCAARSPRKLNVAPLTGCTSKLKSNV